MRARNAIFLVLASAAACSPPVVPTDAAANDVQIPVDSSLPDAADRDAPDRDAPTGLCSTCESFSRPVVAGRVTADELTEASGLVAARRTPGAWFAHNDSGDIARFFALSSNGALRGTYEVTADANDWEDVTSAPCPTGACLVFGDIGDNGESRARVALYRVTEPLVDLGSGPPVRETLASERMRVEYPDGPHNAEALVASNDGVLYVLTKEDNSVTQVFSLGLFRAGETVMATRIAQIDLTSQPNGLVTGADIHPCAPRLLVRTYAAVYLLTAPAGGSLESAFAAPLVRVATPSEPQGETVAWTQDGRAYRTLSEGAMQPMYEARCSE